MGFFMEWIDPLSPRRLWLVCPAGEAIQGELCTWSHSENVSAHAQQVSVYITQAIYTTQNYSVFYLRASYVSASVCLSVCRRINWNTDDQNLM